MKRNVIAIIAALLLAFPLAACEPKKHNEVKKPVTVSQTLSPAEQVQKAKNSLTIEQRVNALEGRVGSLERSRSAARAQMKKQNSPIQGF